MPVTSVNSDVVGFLFFNYRHFKSKAEESFAFEISINITLIKLFKIFHAIYCISLEKRVGLFSLIYCILEDSKLHEDLTIKASYIRRNDVWRLNCRFHLI